MQSGSVGKELRLATAHWWQSGGALWAFGLGFLSVFLWLPSLRLLFVGLGQPGQNAWHGILVIWPHPAFLQWTAKLETWGQGLVKRDGLMIEGVLLGGALLLVMAILARLPITQLWRENRSTNSVLRRSTFAFSVAIMLALPVLGGLIAQGLRGIDSASMAIAAVLALVTLTLAQAGLQSLNPGRVRQFLPIFCGALVSVLGPAIVLVVGIQFVWLGASAQLPLVQLAVLMTTFSTCWAVHHIGVAIGAGFENQRSALADIHDASRGQLAALGLEVVRLLDRNTTLTTGIAVADLADQLGIFEDEASFVLAKLEAGGIAQFWLDESGLPAAALARQVSELCILDVVKVFQADLAMQGPLSHRRIEDCLLYAAYVEQQSMGISLIDLFRNDINLERVQQKLMVPSALPLVSFGKIEAEAVASTARSQSATHPGFDSLDFDHAFWDDVSLEALRGLEVDFDAVEDMSEFPPQPKRQA